MICILRHCAHSSTFRRLARLEGFILLSCDQLTSNTGTAEGFIHYSPALENSIIEIHLVDWNDLFPEAFEPQPSYSDRPTCSSFPLRRNDKHTVRGDRSTPHLPEERSRARWWHFSFLWVSSDAGRGDTRSIPADERQKSQGGAKRLHRLQERSNFLKSITTCFIKARHHPLSIKL